MKKRITLLIPILLVSLLQSACVSAVRPVPSKATPDSPLVVETASMSPLAKILEKLHGERLIYVGETHTRNADHLLQLSVLRSLPADNLALGLEWFQARFQPILEDFIAGRIDEAEMLRQTEYFDRWGFDYRLYRPIIQYAREHHIPIVALNASRELTNAIHDSGIKGIGSEYADLLKTAGVDTIRELRRRNPQRLLESMTEVNLRRRVIRRLPTEGMVRDWVEAAREIEPIVTR